MGFCDLHIVDLADPRLEIFGHVVDQDISIDLLRLALEAALEQQVGLLGKPLKHYFVRIAKLGLVELLADLGLLLH